MRHFSHRAAVPAAVAVVVVVIAWLPVGPVRMAGRLDAAEVVKLKYIGTASCSAKECHGSAAERLEGRTLHNECTTWQGQDKHAKSYKDLANKQGLEISKALSIADPQKSDRCLVCHSSNTPPELRGPKFEIADGNSCEDCHGHAEKWLEPHSRSKPEHKNLKREELFEMGLTDTLDLATRADLCVKCHVKIDHQLLDAKHPNMVFEMDAYQSNMPPHWTKELPFAATKAWAAGQILGLRESMGQLAARVKAGADPKWIDDAYWQARAYGLTSKAIGSLVAPEAAKGLDDLLAALGDERAKVDPAALDSAGGRAASVCGDLARRAAAHDYKAEDGKKLMRALADRCGDVSKAGAPGVHVAEQLALGLDSLRRPYIKVLKPANAKPLKAGITKLTAAVEKADAYKADAFAEMLRSVAGELAK